ncbi:hypothetical protein ABPG74_021217 [Tetrahymena malaccensis]
MEIILSQLFCKKKLIKNHILCRRCSKLIHDSKDACGHKNEQMLLVDFEDKLLDVKARLSHENTFQIFDLIQSQQLILQNLEELRLQFIGGYQPWLEYMPNPFGRNFKTWKCCHKKLLNLKKLVINLSESRIEDCFDVLFQGFEDFGELELEELELDFFSILISTEQLISILQKISQIKSLKKFSLNLGKLARVRVVPELIDEFLNLFKSLTNIESLSINMSSLFSSFEQLQIQSLLHSIEKLANLNSLKISFKNCKLNSHFVPILKQFLENIATNMISLDLDISYNPLFGENLTKELYQSLKQFNQLHTFLINLKGSDSIFSKADYFLLQKLIHKIFKRSIQRYKSTQSIQSSYVRQVQVHLPLTFLRQNLQLYQQQNSLIQNMIKYGPLLYKQINKQATLSQKFRKDIINEIYSEFLI